jgi:predicted aconitase with swiveling domain
MSPPQRFECHRIAEGVAEGDALVSSDDICFYLVDPKSGKIIEEHHAAHGQSVAGKVLVFPSGKGSSVVQADGLYQLTMHGNAPKAMIVQHPDTVLVSSAIIMGIPLVDRLNADFYRTVDQGDWIRVDADQSTVVVAKKSGQEGSARHAD